MTPILARRYDTAQPVRIEIAAGRIVAVTACDTPAAETDRWPWIAPGLIDLQFNGYGGQEFSAPNITPEKVADITAVLDRFGVTRYCPTLTTQPADVLERALRAVAAACEASPAVARRVVGIHLEGPYISAEDGPRGAHPREHCRAPDWDEFQRFQEAADGGIRLLTMSPEYDGAADFIARVVRSGVVVAIGHTAADAVQIGAAVDAGARLSTHLGNGSHLVLPRHANYVWEQLAEDRLAASLIVDGHHLPPAVVKSLVRAKTPERCILVSDMSGLAGRPPGRYAGSLCDVEILPNGRLVVAGQTELLAGAALPIGAGVANVMHFAGVTLAEAVRMATDHPARLLNLAPGGLDVGDPADLVLFDLVPAESNDPPQFEVRATISGGEVFVCHGRA
jgi:N-acetylglucosamine-6-phosphate deacetylase